MKTGKGCESVAAMKRRAKSVRIKPCPFCGKRPSGKRFCSTAQGPTLICDGCGADGPFPFQRPDETWAGENEKIYHPDAIKAWNKRA